MVAPTFSFIDKQVILEIKNKKNLSRADLVRSLAVSKSTITTSVNKFIEDGLITETREIPKKRQRGQPALRLAFNDDRYHFIGLFISAGTMTSAVCDLSANAVWLSDKQDISDDLETTKKQVVALINTAIKNAKSECNHIGIAVPGLLSQDDEILEIAPRGQDIPYHHIIQYIRETFSNYDINISKISAIYAHALKPQNYKKTIFYLGLDEGLSGACFDKNQLFTGGFNQSANIGALLPETGKRPNITDLSHFLNIPMEHLTQENLDDLWHRREPKLLQWIDDRGALLSRPLSAVVQLFSPNKIIVGGLLNQPITEALIKKIDLSYYDIDNRIPVTKPTLVASDEFGEKQLLLSAAAISILRMIY